ncbi:hypothetical protein GGS26DRAFT_596717 [Hypomontagnella submonticulosa]|nr:hypothetical protein GGS26DRAFT_596717 [Hypomontagnella submonticulosa]
MENYADLAARKTSIQPRQDSGGPMNFYVLAGILVTIFVLLLVAFCLTRLERRRNDPKRMAERDRLKAIRAEAAIALWRRDTENAASREQSRGNNVEAGGSRPNASGPASPRPRTANELPRASMEAEPGHGRALTRDDVFVVGPEEDAV